MRLNVAPSSFNHHQRVKVKGISIFLILETKNCPLSFSGSWTTISNHYILIFLERNDIFLRLSESDLSDSLRFLKKKADEVFELHLTKIFRSTVSVYPKTFGVRLPERVLILPRKRQERIALALLSWFLPEEPRVEIQEALLELKSSDSDYLILNFLVSDFHHLKIFLKYSDISTRKFYGTILGRQNLEQLSRHLHWKQESLRIRKTQRIRGYRDKGTLRPSDRWLETQDAFLQEKQLIRENRRSVREKYILLLREYRMKRT